MIKRSDDGSIEVTVSPKKTNGKFDVSVRQLVQGNFFGSRLSRLRPERFQWVQVQQPRHHTCVDRYLWITPRRCTRYNDYPGNAFLISAKSLTLAVHARLHQFTVGRVRDVTQVHVGAFFHVLRAPLMFTTNGGDLGVRESQL